MKYTFLLLFISPEVVWSFIFGDYLLINRNFHQKLINYNSSIKYRDVEHFSQVIYNPPPVLDPIVKRYRKRQAVEPIFKGNPKTREEIWHRSFKMDVLDFDQNESLIILLLKIMRKYLMGCTPVILYDVYVEMAEGFLLQRLMSQLPISYLHGKISSNYTLINRQVLDPLDSSCHSYILFLADVMQTRKILGPQVDNRVIVIPRSTQWKLQEFLMAPASRDIINLLVIGESYSADKLQERPYVLYTHRLFVDGLGQNRPVLLTSSMKGKLSRPHVDLFPIKLRQGFAGHRFDVSAANQPPFVFKKLSTDGVGNLQIEWDGLEVRMLKILSQRMNFTFILKEPRHQMLLGSGDSVVDMMRNKLADFGLAGIYVTTERTDGIEMSVAHSMDCAAFLTLSSRTLPRSRAILGPFQWPVWVCLTLVYLLAIFPLTFSNHLTLKHLMGNWGEMENMFWYVFGTFTNSLTFSGQYSWSSTKKTSTRLLIGVYWVFTIIITACYTGSIIAFVTLPVKPHTIDSIDQLKDGFFRMGTFDRGGWERWFMNSTHQKTAFLTKKLEFVANVEEGVNNVTQAWFWPYAFFASKEELEYIIYTNYTENKIGRRSALHVSDDCFALYSVGISMPANTVYRNKFNDAILRLQQGGLVDKLMRDVKFAEKKRASGKQQPILNKGTPLKMNAPEERGLTLADTEGMFILLGIGFIVAVGALISEFVGGCTNKVISIMKRRKGERIERERVERVEHELFKHEQEHAHDLAASRNESRRPSFFLSNSAGDFRSKSKMGSAKSTDHLSMISNSSTSIPSISKQTLQELYDGPKTKCSAVSLVDGHLVPDDEVYELQREVQLRREIFRAKTPPPPKIGNGSRGSSHSASEKSREFENQFDAIAEVNREVEDTHKPRHRKSMSTVNDDIFGEKVSH